MENVSSSNGHKEYPHLRFHAEDGTNYPDLESYSMGDLYTERKEAGEEGLPILSVSIHTGVSDGELDESETTKRVKRIDDKSLYRKADTGDLVFNMMRAWQGALGVVKTAGMVSPAYIVAKPNEKVYPPYVDYYVKTDNMVNQIHRLSYGVTDFRLRLYWTSFQAVKCHLPVKQEQKHIADFLKKLDERIEKQRELVENLKKYKRGVFEAIFTRKLRLVPKEEQKDWKVFKLNEFASRIKRKNNGTTDIPLTISAQYGLIDQRDFFSKVVASADMSGYYLLRKGEYAYNRSTSNEYPFGSIKRLELYDEGAVSTLYLCFSINENIIVSDFAKWYFESSQWYSSVNKICAEGARNHGLLNIPTDGFFNTTHILPSDIKEQMVIATFLSLIQGKLERSQEGLDQLNQLRNGLMQKLFI